MKPKTPTVAHGGGDDRVEQKSVRVRLRRGAQPLDAIDHMAGESPRWTDPNAGGRYGSIVVGTYDHKNGVAVAHCVQPLGALRQGQHEPVALELAFCIRAARVQTDYDLDCCRSTREH
jgi:hypothetical protein